MKFATGFPVTIWRLIDLSTFMLFAGSSFCNGFVSAGEVAIRITPDAAQFVFGEPLRITIEVTNNTSRAITIPSNGDDFDVFVSREKGPYDERRRYSTTVNDSVGAKLKPSDAMRFERMLFRHGNGDEYFFCSPGRYRLQLRFSHRGEDVESEPLEITVTPPNEAESHRVGFFKRDTVGLLVEGVPNEDTIAGLTSERYMRPYRGTAYFDHICYALGWYFLRKSKDYVWYDHDDNVWALPAVRTWAARRSFEHFGRVSDRIPRLHARAQLWRGVIIAENSDAFLLNDIVQAIEEIEGNLKALSSLAIPTESLPKSTLESLRDVVAKKRQAEGNALRKGDKSN